MIGEPGIYLLYEVYHQEVGEPERRLMGRFYLFDNEIRVLDDYEGLVSSIFPTGSLSGRILQRMNQMANSPYFQLFREEDIQAGQHPEEIEEMDPGKVTEWPTKS